MEPNSQSHQITIRSPNLAGPIRSESTFTETLTVKESKHPNPSPFRAPRYKPSKRRKEQVHGLQCEIFHCLPIHCYIMVKVWLVLGTKTSWSGYVHELSHTIYYIIYILLYTKVLHAFFLHASPCYRIQIDVCISNKWYAHT